MARCRRIEVRCVVLSSHISQSGTAGTCDRINVVANWEVNYWATRWGVTPDQLLRAIAEVGTNVRVVQAHLAAHASAAFS
jgi:hypothetical protein